MKRYFIYLAIVAITSSIFLNTPVPVGGHAQAIPSKATIVSKTQVQPKASEPKADAVTTAAEQAPVTSQPAFDPNNQATWPTCAANQFVRADNGQCQDNSTPAPAAVVPTSTPAPVQAPVPSYGGSHEDIMAAAGIAASDYAAVDYIVSHESGWNQSAVNASSGSCGLIQELPCGKSGCSFGDGICQLEWASGYASSRYGGWWGAYNFWQANQWW